MQKDYTTKSSPSIVINTHALLSANKSRETMPIGVVAKDRHTHRYMSSNACKWMAQSLSIASEVARGKVHHSKHSATLGE